MKKILAVFNIILILIFFIGTTTVYAELCRCEIPHRAEPDERGCLYLLE